MDGEHLNPNEGASRLNQEDNDFKDNLDYTVKPCQKLSGSGYLRSRWFCFAG